MVATKGYFEDMRAVGVKVLKNKLSEYIRLAAGGERILVTDRDRVVAELVPPESGRAELLGDARLAEAVREGWLSPPVLRVAEPPARYPVTDLASVLGELDRDRDDR
jgi:antitoxin (DNA-binding transcriptional repressor) of toxin-antitoxin stability system